MARARKLLDEVPLVDGHNDLPWEIRKRVQNHSDKLDLRADTAQLDPPMHTDIPRLRKGGVGGQFWSVYIPVEVAGADAASRRRWSRSTTSTGWPSAIPTPSSWP